VRASIVFQGHTEDGEMGPEGVLPASAVQVSGASGSPATGTLLIVFRSALNTEDASDATRYKVLINGVETPVQEASYSTAGPSVSLLLPGGLLRSGDQVIIRWSNIRDAKSLLFSGQFGPITVPANG
jgi:hypothetical protein